MMFLLSWIDLKLERLADWVNWKLKIGWEYRGMLRDSGDRFKLKPYYRDSKGNLKW